MAPSPASPAPDALAAAMRSLYAVTPDEFMAERTRVVAEARAAGDSAVAAELGRLRKPSLAAWSVNLLVREASDLVEGLADLGERMRGAQGRLDTAALTSLRPERDALLDELVRATVRLVADAGRTCSAAVQQDVRATAIAALADEQAMVAVSSGQLTRALSYSGFGEVDLAEAVVRTTSGAILSIVPVVGGSGAGRSGAGRSGAARSQWVHGPGAGHDADAATGQPGATDQAALEAALAAAEARVLEAETAVGRARERAEETRERLVVVERQLTKAREADERALEAVTDAVRARKSAHAARHTAQAALDEARSDS